MNGPLIDRIRRVVSAELPPDAKALLAVSGGVDSMVLLDAAIASRPNGSLRVATFDHQSGPHSATAAELVQTVAMAAGVTVVVGRSDDGTRPTEAAWRKSRLSFLNAAAAECQAVLCTAHTRDDQIETVLFRELRGAGPRGLAGLKASSAIRRPLLAVGRAEIEEYARLAGVRWIDDPSNASRAFARNRLRMDLLPALRALSPSIDTDLTEIGESAAQWRADVDGAIDAAIRFHADRDEPRLEVGLESLRPHGADTLAIIWPALLARIGATADWRGTRRLVEFTRSGSTGRQIQLSGGWVVARRRTEFVVSRGANH